MPEIVLLATVCVMFLVGPFLVSDGRAGGGRRAASLGRTGARGARARPGWSGSTATPTSARPAGCSRPTRLAWFTRGLSLTVGVLLVLVLWNQIDDAHAAEAHACLLSIVAGTNLVAAANDLVALFLALELVSIPTYVILYLPRRDRGDARSHAQVFSAERVLVGPGAVRHELAVRRGGHDESRGDSRGALARPDRGDSADSPRRVRAAGGRAVLSHHGRAVPLLCPGRVSRHDGVERGAALVRAEDRRLRGAGAADAAHRGDDHHAALAAGRIGAGCCWRCWPWPRCSSAT